MHISYKNQKVLYKIFLFLFVIAIHIPWINWEGIIVSDTQDYIDVSLNWLKSDSIQIRPIGYPLFLYINRLINPNSFVLTIIFQVILYASTATLFLEILFKLSVFRKNWIAFICAIFIFSNPQSLSSNSFLLPEMPPLFFIVVLIYLLLFCNNRFITKLLIFIIIVFTYFLKPIWFVLILTPMILFFNNGNNGKLLILLFIFIISIPFFINKTATTNPIDSKYRSNIDACVNSSLIRMGIMKGGESTVLYEAIEKNKLTDKIKSRNWTDKGLEFNEFRKLYDTLRNELWTDNVYWKKVLFYDLNNFKTYFFKQLSRLPKYFSTSASNLNVKFNISFIDNLYQRLYAGIHKYRIVGVLLIFYFLMIFNKNYFFRSYGHFHILLLYIILSSAGVIIFFTYQNPHFLRMRAVTEPLILFTTFFTCYKIIIFILKKSRLRNDISH